MQESPWANDPILKVRRLMKKIVFMYISVTERLYRGVVLIAFKVLLEREINLAGGETKEGCGAGIGRNFEEV